MTASIRPATAADIASITSLLMDAAKQRSTYDPVLWHVDDQSAVRISDAITAILNKPAPQKDVILLAEAAGKPVGISHGMIVAPPPIYDVKVTPGLLLDDFSVTSIAPQDTAEALLGATEAALTAVGATSFIASTPTAAPQHALYTGSGYEPVTLYMAKHTPKQSDTDKDIRPAAADDIEQIVTLSAAHRKALQEINDRFWHIHPEADQRFGMWMRYSLTLKDRDMLVADGANGLAGYIIAQPIAGLIVPAAHDIKRTGVIDDFYDTDFATITDTAPDSASSEHLLAAAETTFAKRGFNATLTVCPANWTSKRTILEANGYKSAKVWMLKKV